MVKKFKTKTNSNCYKYDVYNTDFCILIDMKIHSGKDRMFVWNFKTKIVDKKALCAHGCGKGDNLST